MCCLQDNETAAGTCPLCRAPLTPQGLFPRSALLPPGYQEEASAAQLADAELEAELQRYLRVRDQYGTRVSVFALAPHV